MKRNLNPAALPHPGAHPNRRFAVLERLPDGIVERPSFSHFSVREAYGTVQEHFRIFTYCEACGGWIEAEAEEIQTHTILGLTGRAGVVYCCARCGVELAFSGSIA